MTTGNNFYLDEDLQNNPNFSEKMLRFYKVLLLITGSTLIIVALYNIIYEGKYWLSINLIFGVIHILIYFLQPWFYKKYGRKFIRLTDSFILLKLSYFETPKTINTESIAEVKFEGEKFIITNRDEGEEKIIFKAGLGIYEKLRTLLRDWAGNQQIPVVE